MVQKGMSSKVFNFFSVVNRIRGAPDFLSFERIFYFSSQAVLISYFPGPGFLETYGKVCSVFILIEYFEEGTESTNYGFGLYVPGPGLSTVFKKLEALHYYNLSKCTCLPFPNERFRTSVVLLLGLYCPGGGILLSLLNRFLRLEIPNDVDLKVFVGGRS